jgi:hypothetical protein
LPIAGALPTTGQAAADPIFAAIDAHRAANDAHWAAINEAGNRMDWGAITEQPCHDENDALDILIGAVATTSAGLRAKLAYLRTIADSEKAWMLDERQGTSAELLKSLVTTLENIGVQS